MKRALGASHYNIIERHRYNQAPIIHDTKRDCPTCGKPTDQQLTFQSRRYPTVFETWKCHECGTRHDIVRPLIGGA